MAKGLGKGFQALFPDQEAEETILEVKLDDLRPNPYQPRKHFSDDAIQELKQSIEEHGVLQPLIVRKSIKGYEIVVGERRYRAAKEAGLAKVPAVEKELTDEQMMEIALIENLQREDLNPLEEARAYEKLMQELSFTQEALAKRLGKSRPYIANQMRLLHLPSSIQTYITNGSLTVGHGRTLLGLEKKDQMQAVAEKVIREQLNVRQLEQLVQKLNNNVSRETKKEQPKKDVFLIEKEELLRDRFGTSVSIKKNKKKGKIEIEFLSDDDLERILHLLESK